MDCKKPNGRVLVRLLPVLVWLLAVAAIVVLYVHRNASFHVVGIAFSQTCTFTAPDSGFLVSLPVTLHQEVRQGQPLAVLRLIPESEVRYTQAQFEAEKAAALAELEHLKVQAAAAEQDFIMNQSQGQMETLYRDHQLALDVEKARLLVLEIQTTLEPAKIQLQDLELEKQALTDLVNRKAVEPYELRKIEYQAAALAVQIEQQQQQLEQSRRDLETASSRLEAFRASRPAPVQTTVSLESLQRAISLQEKRLAELLKPDFDIILKSPFDGVVSSICYTAGQTIMKDLPILTVTAPVPEHVVAWLDQDYSGTLTLNQPVELVKTSLPRRVMRSEISRIGPALELMPERLWHNPSVPQWGRPIMIPVHPEMQLVPNEIVGVRGI
jgi:multidrug resistance efflux pump